MKYISYPNNLENILEKHKNIFIPKRVPNKQKYYKNYHKYFCKEFSSESYFKVIESYNVEDINYVTLSFSDNIYWTIPNEINEDEVYELIYNKNDLLNQNIINSDISYYGYEIIYWFYNKFNYKYSEFIPYIEDGGKCRVNENCKYFLYAKYRNGKYINIQLKTDRRIEKNGINK
jgi:hypothetical protein